MRFFANDGWNFYKDIQDKNIDFNRTLGNVETVRLPHTVAVTPFNCFDESMYRGVFFYEKDITVKTQSEADNLNEKCPECNDMLKETSSMDLADEFVELAEEMNTDVEFISTETEEGNQIYRAFGGIVAILRYYVDY